jgi:hypothetical protein
MAAGMGDSGDDDLETGADWAWRDVLAAHADANTLARAVTRARVAERLFATKQQVKLGRYQLLAFPAFQECQFGPR